MRLTASFYTFLIFNLRLCCSNMASFQHVQSQKSGRNCTNCRNVQREIESIKQMEMIKIEIMRRLNISGEKPVEKPDRKQTTPKPEPEVTKSDHEYRGADILSYSEPPDNFTDENIVQFRLGNNKVAGSRLFVKSANLLVRVKYKRRKKPPGNIFRSKRNILKGSGKKTKTKKSGKSKAVDLKLYTVNKDGEPGNVITSVTSRLKKTKWLKLSLPRNIVQSAIDTNNSTFQVYITCRGCGKRANVILVHKSRKRKRNRQTKRNRKLHKRRPMLITRVTEMERKERGTKVTADKTGKQQTSSDKQH